MTPGIYVSDEDHALQTVQNRRDPGFRGGLDVPVSFMTTSIPQRND
ncbi:hypothetical protein ACFS5N_10400 [Mucilaginibacter ximonensis]|uniref:Uncharacterized protein n=1 Tax=Mucilaginibacter ximonensis TaxID=538021 RepID=A0ABW5YBW3_9SPHI